MRVLIGGRLQSLASWWSVDCNVCVVPRGIDMESMRLLGLLSAVWNQAAIRGKTVHVEKVAALSCVPGLVVLINHLRE